jgi:hypothetical protein
MSETQPAPMGRPSLYEPEYCQTVLALGAEGKSVTVMAAKIGVCRDTLYAWAETYPEFSDALTRAKTLSQMWWEDTGQSAMFLPGFNGSVWAKSMAARFPDEWRDNTRTELVGKDGGAIKHDVTAGLSEATSRFLESMRTPAGSASGPPPVPD